MAKPALVVLAAGMGSRYGGLKQIDPVGPNGEIIIDYSLYDAVQAGFDHFVFIIKKEIFESFYEKVGKKAEKMAKVSYVYQELSSVLPEGFTVPEGRVKPWGTSHALLCCKDVLDGPFAVINADDFYGRGAFSLAYDFLAKVKDDDKINLAMIGYLLENTLTENGAVSRGVCKVDQNGYLIGIDERKKVEKFADGVKYQEKDGSYIRIPDGSVVSLNLWGFGMSIFPHLESGFENFLKNGLAADPEKGEYFLPLTVDEMLKAGKARVKVIPTDENWYGVTYKEDKEKVKAALTKLYESGVYPAL